MIFRKFVLIWLLTTAIYPLGEAIASPREDAIKSGFLYNFASYSHGDWFNAAENSSYNICSFNTQFASVAKHTLKGLSIEGLPVVIHLLASEIDTIQHCDTLFISNSDIDKWHIISEREQLSNIMLVGENDRFLAAGGHINFYIVGGKVRFEVNPVKLKQSGINMSSKVLRLGKVYKGEQNDF